MKLSILLIALLLPLAARAQNAPAPQHAQPPSSAAIDIYRGICPNCTGFSDAVEGLANVPANFSGAQQTGLSAYVLDNAAASHGLRNGVGAFLLGVGNVPGANVWGWNSMLTDSANRTKNNNTGIILQNEADFNIYSPHTVAYGMVVVGASTVAPAASVGLVCDPLGVRIPWNTCVQSNDGAANNVLYGGLLGAVAGNNVPSQFIKLASTDAKGAHGIVSLQASGGDTLAIAGGNGAVHVAVKSTAAPTVTGCGAGCALHPGASDVRGTINEGASASGAVLTFAAAYATVPECVVSSPTGTALGAYTATATTLTLTHAATSNAKFTYICLQ